MPTPMAQTTLTPDMLRRRVAALPRLALAHLPTPLEELPRFTAKTTVSAASISSAPTLSYITPSAVAVGSGGFTLTLSGSNFLSTSKVLWNGSPRAVNHVSNMPDRRCHISDC